MKQRIFLSFCLILMANALKAQDSIEVIHFDKLEKIMQGKGRGIKVINFWATWCAPCVKELPYFEALNKAYGQKGVEVILVSLDFVEKKEKLEQFIKKRRLASKVLLLDEIDYDSWINKVDQRWSGSIPATLILDGNSGKRKFVEKELKEGELERLIETFMD